MRTLILQPWATFEVSDFVQGAEGWLDLSEFSDAIFWIDVAQADNLVLTFETSPSWDETYFQPLGPTIELSADTTTVFRTARSPTTSPITRWVRWNAAGSSGTATFRIRVSPSRQLSFMPTDLPGCALWLRSDLAVTATPYVYEWDDSSNSGDSNENTLLYNGSYLVGYTAPDPDFNNWPSLQALSVNNAGLVSHAWATPLQQPSTWVVVATCTSGGGDSYLIDSNDATTGQTILYSGGTTVTISANGGSVSATTPWTGTCALLGEWNGSSSNLYFNDFTTALASGTVGGGSAGSQGSLSVLMQNPNHGSGPGPVSWAGSLAEVIAFSGILSPTQKAQLRLYLNSRYNLSIT
jgi:hypothetical protein